MTLVKHTPNWQLVAFSTIAFSRGVLYALPVREVLPPPLDLLSKDLVYLYGIGWFVAALFGYYAAFAHRYTEPARRGIVTMLAIWTTIYVYAGFTNPTMWGFWTSAAFYACIAWAVAVKPKPRIVYISGPPIEVGDQDASS